jgi:hypothetical protein
LGVLGGLDPLPFGPHTKSVHLQAGNVDPGAELHKNGLEILDRPNGLIGAVHFFRHKVEDPVTALSRPRFRFYVWEAYASPTADQHQTSQRQSNPCSFHIDIVLSTQHFMKLITQPPTVNPKIVSRLQNRHCIGSAKIISPEASSARYD